MRDSEIDVPTMHQTIGPPVSKHQRNKKIELYVRMTNLESIFTHKLHQHFSGAHSMTFMTPMSLAW